MVEIISYLKNALANKNIVILGFGKEGKSTYRFLRKYFPDRHLIIADANNTILGKNNDLLQKDDRLEFITGTNYLKRAEEEGDVFFKSPGIPLKSLPCIPVSAIYSQTDLFLKFFGKQTVGVTGTKGKSTTVSLLFHLLKKGGKNPLLGGNIGVPPLDLIEKITEQTDIVLEISSHQLETASHSPRIAVLLNIFQEHLDHYNSFYDYQMAKFNIVKWQNPGDYSILPHSTDLAGENIDFSSIKSSIYHFSSSPLCVKNGVSVHGDDIVIYDNGNQVQIKGVLTENPLLGNHNLNNVVAASLAAYLSGVSPVDIKQGITTFPGLPHRLQYVGEFSGVRCYNDSISTVPQSTVAALESLPETQTVLLGGKDRGIDYAPFADYLVQQINLNLVCIGEAGKRILENLQKSNPGTNLKTRFFDDFDLAVLYALKITQPGKVLLLSPAASSYDMFENFEKRGERFVYLLNNQL
jgi:UDP-N-acetylmuramoyl-L-alanine---L-glutamate ligase